MPLAYPMILMILALGGQQGSDTPEPSEETNAEQFDAILNQFEPITPRGVATPRDYGQRIQDILSGDHILRGVMLLIAEPHDLAEEDLRRLRHEFGANHVRLYFAKGTGVTHEEHRILDDWHDKDPEASQGYAWTFRLFQERWEPLFQELDLPIIVPLMGTEFDVQDQESPFWTDPEQQEAFIEMCVERARIWSQSDATIAYNLLNEPIPPGSRPRWRGPLYWDWTEEEAREDAPDGDRVLAELYNEIIRRIREFDRERIIIVEPGPFGTPWGFPGLLHVEDDPRLVFSFHQYAPHGYTHYGHDAWQAKDPALLPPIEQNGLYPDEERGWNRDAILDMYEYVREFQRKREAQTGRPCIIWVGELGLTRFSDKASQHRWIVDSVKPMEEYGWGWAYFVYSAGTSPWWDHFGYYGPEGDDLDVQEYFRAYRELDFAAFEAYRDKVRPSFALLIEYMRESRNE